MGHVRRRFTRLTIHPYCPRPAVPSERCAVLRRLSLLVALAVAGVLLPIGPLTSSADAACVPRIKSLTAAKTAFVSGDSTRMTVLLTCAPRRKKIVYVKVDHRPNVYTSAWFVTVRARQRTATFTVHTNFRPTTVRVKVQARLAGTSRWVASTPLVKASPSACNPKAITTPHLVLSGAKTTGKLTLTCALDVPKTVSLEAISATGSNQVESFFHVPSSVTVPAKQPSVTFPITFGTSAHPQHATVSVAGSARIVSFIQYYPGLSGITVTSETTDTGMRRLRVETYTTYPAPENFVVRLTSSDPRFSLPAATIPEGTTSAQVVSLAAPPPETNELVTVTASPHGSTQQLTEEVLVER